MHKKSSAHAPTEALLLLNQLDEPLRQVDCDGLACQVGFKRRKQRKIAPTLLLKAFCLASLYAPVSFAGLAFQLGLLIHDVISKHGIAHRMSSACVEWVKTVLFAVLAQRVDFPTLKRKGVFATFQRVLLQDSTCLALADRLASFFPGSRNQRKAFACLKIQVVYDLLQECFVGFRLSGFTRNDQAAAPDILAIARPGDLILRDLGYFVLSVFEVLVARGICFGSRFRSDVALLEPLTERPLNLLKHLRRYRVLDQVLWLGKDHHLPVRVVALPLAPAVAAERRRKARQNRDRRCAPSKVQLELLGWEIFITNVPQTVWPSATVAEVYGLRWRIEIMFKAWKSHFRLATLSAHSAQQVQVLLYARLLIISLFQVHCFFPLNQGALAQHQTPISLLKFARCVAHPLVVLLLPNAQCDQTAWFSRLLLKYCAYEKRRKRKNFGQRLASLS